MGVQDLTINLITKTAAFSKGMAGASLQLKHFGGSAMAAGQAVNKGMLIASTAAIAAGTALAMPIKYTMASIDSLSKMSDQLGIATEKLAGLKYAAGLSGTSIDAVQKSVLKMSESLDSAATGSGAAYKAMQQLNLTTKDLVGLSPDDKFKLIADRLIDLNDATQRAVVGTDIFGRSYKDISSLLLSGSKGINQAIKEAEKLGLSFSRIDGSMVEAANDAVTKVRESLNGIYVQMSVGIAPYLKVIADDMVSMGKNGVQAFGGMQEGVLTFISTLEMAIRSVDTLKAGFNVTNALTNLVHGKIAESKLSSKKELLEKLQDPNIKWAYSDKVKKRLIQKTASDIAYYESLMVGTAKEQISSTEAAEGNYANMGGKRMDELREKMKKAREEMNGIKTFSSSKPAEANGSDSLLSSVTGAGYKTGGYMAYDASRINVAALTQSPVQNKELEMQKLTAENTGQLVKILSNRNADRGLALV